LIPDSLAVLKQIVSPYIILERNGLFQVCDYEIVVKILKSKFF
jgi:hypothetical protein